MHPQQQILFTPGPLLTSQSVKEACLIDMGSRDPKFIQIIDEIRFRLLALANAPQDRYAAVLLQGSGSYGLEAVLQTAVNKKLHKYAIAPMQNSPTKQRCLRRTSGSDDGSSRYSPMQTL